MSLSVPVRQNACGTCASAAMMALLAAGALCGVAAASSAAANVPGCIGSRLTAVYVNTTVAAGTRAGEYGFENRSSTRCSLIGSPKVEMLSASGAKLASSVRHTASGAFGISAKRVELARNGIAYFAIVYGSQTGFGRLGCPASSALALTAPGTSTPSLLKGRGARIAAYAGTQVHLQCGVLRVSAVTAKRFQ